MKGLELSETYYYDCVEPMIKQKFRHLSERIAVGLVGEGSECYGYDDDISRDHDWGASVCIWLTAEDYQDFGNQLQEALDHLPANYKGYPVLHETREGLERRRGVLEMGSFYRKFLGTEGVPVSLTQWRIIPEHNLAAATNGKVFADPLERFSHIRNKLIDEYYPEDIRLKKIAARCMIMAQAGQYNYPRVISRSEFVAAHLAMAEFIKATVSMIFLLNKRYQPFYKWMHRGLLDLPELGSEIHVLLNELMKMNGNEKYTEKINTIEEISQMIINVLRQEGLSDSKSDFLLNHGPSVMQRISNEVLGQSNCWVE